MENLPTEEELGLAIDKIINILAKQDQGELGWIHSETSHIKGYPGETELNQEIQSRVNNAVGGVSIVYIFALLETYIPRALWNYGNEDMKKRMYAYLHIRNTVAHGFDGKRADRYTEQFNEIMESDKPIKGILNHTDIVIKLDSTVWFDLKKLIPNFLNSIYSRVLNHGY